MVRLAVQACTEKAPCSFVDFSFASSAGWQILSSMLRAAVQMSCCKPAAELLCSLNTCDVRLPALGTLPPNSQMPCSITSGEHTSISHSQATSAPNNPQPLDSAQQ